MSSDVAKRSKSSTASVLAEATALENEGRCFDAVHLLHAANRQCPTVDIERALVRLRLRAFKRTAAPSVEERGALPSLPLHPKVGVAAAAAEELTANTLRAGILQSGALFIPRFLDSPKIARMTAAIDNAMEGRIAARKKRPDRPYEWFDQAPVGKARLFLGNEALLVGDSPRGLFELMETLYELHFDRVLAEYFGEPGVLSFDKCTFRRAVPNGGSSWHQDGAFMGADCRALNLWVTLSECGRDAPSLEIIPRRIDHILKTGAYFDWDVAPELIAAELPGIDPVVPELEPGDAFFFDHFFLHRTYRAASMTKTRYALENWFFAPSAYPADGTGLIV